MLKIESREAANLKSRVKDLSQVPNLVNYAGLFACITPLSKNAPVDDGSGNVLYEPVLIRDTNSLIQHFGDPRIDPEKYVDLYSIMQIVGDGTSCYVAKVSSGQPGVYPFDVCNAPISEEPDITGENKVYTYSDLGDEPNIVAVYDETVSTHTLSKIEIVDKSPTDGQCTVTVTPVDDKYSLVITLHDALENGHNLIVVNKLADVYGMTALSALEHDVVINAWVTQAKPYSIKAYYLKVNVVYNGNILVTSKIKLDDSVTNQGLANGLTSLLSPYVSFELNDASHKDACALNDERDFSIVKKILDLNAPVNIDSHVRENLEDDILILDAQGEAEGSGPTFRVSIDDYVNALNQYKDKKYVGCLMADMVAPLSHFYYNNQGKEVGPADIPFGVPTPSERRTLHYWIKQIACERKDVNVILSVPLIDNDNGDEEDPQRYSVTTKFTIDDACNWVSSTGTYSTLWEYGHTDTTDYAEQSFYLEMYFTWLSMNCVKLEDGIAKSAVVQVAPANVVAQNVLRSYRERGPHLPVAGDQYGALPSSYSVIVNPKTKAQRDQLVQYRINPIYDTGTRGVQIYGNETLNAGYTDLNAAHIARELVNIRSRIDEYTETLKFMLNNAVLWDTWKAYVSTNILDPAKSINAIKSYAVAMGYDTTTPEEMANRMVKGQVSLQFYQSAEIFDLTFTIFSTSAETLG